MLQLITTTEDLQDCIDKALEKAYNRLPTITTTESLTEIIDGKELIKRLGLSEPTLIRWRQKGKIPFFRIGTAIRYDWNKVLNALEIKQRKNK